MTTTTRAGFTAQTNTNGYTKGAYCFGTNHSDTGTLGNCDACGWPVVKTESGRIVDTPLTNQGRFSCWSPAHECNPETAADFASIRANKIASGEIIKGATVTVVKGRKVAHGTTGTVTWIGTDSYGKGRVGFRTANGESIFTAATNVTAG